MKLLVLFSFLMVASYIVYRCSFATRTTHLTVPPLSVAPPRSPKDPPPVDSPISQGKSAP
ncbi:MAG: hypothetical protein H7249_19130 [Chitinophagaceae bacterium]|nr:hypothetical protein [Oligoflexus sp.]